MRVHSLTLILNTQSVFEEQLGVEDGIVARAEVLENGLDNSSKRCSSKLIIFSSFKLRTTTFLPFFLPLQTFVQHFCFNP